MEVTCTECKDRMVKHKCSNQYKCKIDSQCTNKYPCKQFYLECAGCSATQRIGQGTKKERTPKKTSETMRIPNSVQRPVEPEGNFCLECKARMNRHKCSNQYKCKIDSQCTNKYPCKQFYLECTECSATRRIVEKTNPRPQIQQLSKIKTIPRQTYTEDHDADSVTSNSTRTTDEKNEETLSTPYRPKSYREKRKFKNENLAFADKNPYISHLLAHYNQAERMKKGIYYAGRLREIRRKLHMNPELSFCEHDTSELILETLKQIDGITEIRKGWGRPPKDFKGAVPGIYKRPVNGAGITAVIKGELGEGECIAFRADMDALPILETSKEEYRSENTGVMHACGHDGHVAMLLVAAEVIANNRSKLRGSIKLIFQPAEEFGGGAKYLVKESVLKNVNKIFGIHLWTPLNVGHIGVSHGEMMASPDKFTISIKGKGGHGAAPHKTVDALLVASYVNIALQSIVSRRTDPMQEVVVSVCKMENEEGSNTCGCGHTFNVICGEVVMHGTSRAFTPDMQKKLRQEIQCVATNTAKAHGASATVEFDDLNYGYPPTVNTKNEAVYVELMAAEIVNPQNIHTGRDIMTMGGEDFSYYLEQVPGCMIFVGATGEGKEELPHHHPSFDFDETALEVGAALWVKLAGLDNEPT
eukprot:m.61605 g.61605  ORF g.61605 m.61605 type:complete len:643 (-) comp11429_c0_seq1:228-2156(-)